MTSTSSYLNHHLLLLDDLYRLCQNQPPFNSPDSNDTDREIIDGLKSLSESTAIDDQTQALGQSILTRIIANYPHITPAINRDLFWFYGGDCLHFMGDDEIVLYQQIDELLHEQPGLDYQQAKTRAFQLH